MQNPSVDLIQLRPVLAALGLAAPLVLTELRGGSNRVFRVDLDDGGAVTLKTYDDLRGKLPVGEAYAASLLVDLDLPVTRYLAIDESRSRLPFRFALTNHLHGDAVQSHTGVADVADAYREMGRALRRLHTVRLPAYARFGDGTIDSPAASNSVAVRRRITRAFAEFRRYGADAQLVAALEAQIERLFAAVTWGAGPVFVHDDLHPNNVLVKRDDRGQFRLSGVLDFGNAFAGDAVSDLAKTLFCCEHDAPGSTPAILEGYGPIDHPHPELALWFYTLLHRVTMWWWLRHVGVIADGERHDLIADLERMADAGTLTP
ncbi:MAG: aminoglycoside phosphotransferase family protein [Devosia sp.]|nr:aminoglycoside phosphotransferase family protein [Devosia sp.]